MNKFEGMQPVKCANCGKEVIPVNRVNRGWFNFFSIVFGGFFGKLYFHSFSQMKKPTTCPECGDDVYILGKH